MRRQKILLIDSAINFVLGLLLITFPLRLVQLLGVPTAVHSFYPNILGAVLTGIGVALLIEYFRGTHGIGGLGLGGAVAINLFAGLALGLWLVSGKLEIPFRGQFLLWLLVIILVVLSGGELLVHRKGKHTKAGV
jgi:hypothetical protein